MGGFSFEIDADIRRAWTPPSWVYSDQTVYAIARERVFGRSWQFVGHADEIRVPGQVRPIVLLEGCLDEPLVLVRRAERRESKWGQTSRA